MNQVYQPKMPDGRDAPHILTPEEACEFLRLSGTPKQRLETLRYMRDRGKIKGVRCGRHFNYAVTELVRYAQEEAA